jgi:hypothetical protein
LALAALATAALGFAPPMGAQSAPGYGRISVFWNYMQTTRSDGGAKTTFNEVSAIANVVSASADDGGFEYALDARGADYPSSNQTNRVSLYNAWVGGRINGGGLGLRAGQMWINDLGGLGAVGGVQLEARPFKPSEGLQFRIGLFGGVEPDLYQVGYVSGVKKYGGYVALDGERGWKNVLGYVLIKDRSVTERSVITMLNFIPIGKEFFLYQAAEIDTTGPAGTGGGAQLTYIFVNARYQPANWVEFQALYHQGISIDTRSIAQDVLNGRPVSPSALDGFLFGSIGGRITFLPIPSLRIWGGYAQEKSTREGETYPRIQAGISTTNLFGTGLDLTASDFRYNRSSGSYDAIYASIGRSIGPRLYLTFDYTTSLSVLSLTNSDGVVVQSRPRSKRFALSGTVNISRAFSLLLTAEQISDDTTRQFRALTGITYRF